MTRQERQSASAAKKLVKALEEIEKYNGDPSDILTDAQIQIYRSKHQGAKDALKVLVQHYEEESKPQVLETSP